MFIWNFLQSARAMKLHEHPAVKDLCGGAAIGALARRGDEQRYQLITSQYSAKMRDCSFSFGGMLTHAQRMIEKGNIRWDSARSASDTETVQNLNDFAACLQSSIVRHIETRVHRAILFCDQVKKPQWRRTLVGARARRCRTTNVSLLLGSLRWSVE